MNFSVRSNIVGSMSLDFLDVDTLVVFGLVEVAILNPCGVTVLTLYVVYPSLLRVALHIDDGADTSEKETFSSGITLAEHDLIIRNEAIGG